MVSCNICGWTGESFEPLYDYGNVYCRCCGSYERHRALIYYLERAGLLARRGTALEIGGGLVRANRLYLESKHWTYYALDFSPGAAADVRGDASLLPFPTACFDLIICTHVLEHVDDDFRALGEIRRTTRENGLALIQVPYDDTRFNTRENELTINGNVQPVCHYHHKRDYGLDILERLAFFFERVTEIDPLLVIPEAESRTHGFNRNFGTTFFCGGEGEYPGKLYRNLLPLKRLWLTEWRAFEIFLSRPNNGGALENWLEAESQVACISDDSLARLNVYEILGSSAIKGT